MNWFKSSNEKKLNKAISKFIVEREWEAAKNHEDFYIDDEYIKDICNRVMYALQDKIEKDKTNGRNL